MLAVDSTVYIVDDDDDARTGLQELMESVGLNTEIFASAEGFLERYPTDANGCLVLDIRMPGMGGMKLQEELNRRQSQLPILFLTGHGDIPMAVKALQAGALDFIEKPPSGQYLLDKVHEALEEAKRRRLRAAEQSAIGAKLSSLTPRETEIIEYVKQGMSSKSMAMKMGLSRKTVDWHLSMIRDRLEVNTNADLLLLLHQAETPEAQN